MAWTPQERRRFVQGLGEVDRGISTFYQYLLYGLLVAVTGFAFFLHRQFVNDAFHDFLDIFLGVLYLMFLVWALGTLLMLRRRIAASREPEPLGSPNPNFQMKFGRDPETGATGFSLRLGANPPPDSSPTSLHWGVSLSSVADEDKLDDDALARAERYRAEGRSLEEICQLLNSRYGNWGGSQQQVYRAYLKGMLESREATANAATVEPVQPQEPPAAFHVRPAAGDSEGGAFIPGVRLTPGQVTFLVIVLGILLGALFSVVWLARAVK